MNTMTEAEIYNIFKNYIFNIENGIQDLVNEVLSGKTRIEIIDNLPTMIVNIGFCEIINNNKKLIEVEQKFKNGFIRNRNQPVTGTLRYTDDPKLEMLREIRKELSIRNIDEYFYKIQFSHKLKTAGISSIYPDVSIIWYKHYYKWHMPDSLVKSEYIEIDNRKISTFRWVDI